MAELDVVIVSWRCEALLRRCLRSLVEHPAAVETCVRVVDNASNDGTAEMVAREFPEVELTVNDTNTGFSAGCNTGLRASRSRYVLLLNPDTEVPANALDSMLELLEQDQRIGAAGPRLERADGSFDHASRRSFPTIASSLGHFTGLGRRGSGRLAAYRAPEIDRGPVEAINGAFMLLRRSALDAVGLLDEGYWMYMEDLDLCYRLAEAGWSVFYEPRVTVRHTKAGTSGKLRGPRLNYAFHYGMWRFYRRHYAPSRPRLVNLAVLAGIAAKLGLSIARSALLALNLRNRKLG